MIALFALWIRTHDLDVRTMHADEANQGVKTGELLEAGTYVFDPRDHHGPTLYYAAAVLAKLRGEHSLAQLTEITLRLVPAFFGTLGVILLALLAAAAAPAARDPASRRGPPWMALAAAALMAIAPPAVYYSRYFVQETLLVTFTLWTVFAALRWRISQHLGWAIAAGIGVGLMQATKASAPLFLAAAALAALVACRPRASAPAATLRSIRRPLLAALIAGFVTMALFYTSLGTNPRGLWDAFSAYGFAATRFGSDAGPTGHEKPWWYYLRLFGWHREGGLLWHQVALSALAVTGLGVAIGARRETTPVARFARGTAVYTVLIVGLFSAFAYKTPWHAVHFVPGFALLAAFALAAVARLPTGRLVAAAMALATLGTLYQQTGRAAFLRPGDARNPYAYVHSSADVRKFRPAAEAALARSPGQPIHVIIENREYWPLPWYFRGLPNVGYWPDPPQSIDGALVIASASHVPAVRDRLRGTYRESFLGIRPGFICILFSPEP